ncbi:MAG: MerR family DNA-binding transcriptional regulator [Solirubrobacterales bacterium]
MSEEIRIGAAASILGVSVDTLRRWEKEGKITFGRTSGGQRTVETGFHAGDMAILAVEGLVFIAVGTWLFLRRDIH